MSAEEAPARAGPNGFALTAEEAAIVASRAGLRAALAGRLSLHHVAPLAAFALFLALVAISASSGLIGGRLAEGGLILAGIAFMAVRMAAHWRMREARMKGLAAATTAEAFIQLDDVGLLIGTAAGSRRILFAECGEAEHAGGFVYLWPRVGTPAFIPARAFTNEQAAQIFYEALREGISRARRRA